MMVQCIIFSTWSLLNRFESQRSAANLSGVSQSNCRWDFLQNADKWVPRKGYWWNSFLFYWWVSEQDTFDFGVIVSNTPEFTAQAPVCPSKKPPPREPDVPQAWISVDDKVLEKPLGALKRMVFALIHHRPAITTVSHAFCASDICRRKSSPCLVVS